MRLVPLEASLRAELLNDVESQLDALLASALGETDGITNFDFREMADGTLAGISPNAFPSVDAWVSALPQSLHPKAFDRQENFKNNVQCLCIALTFGDGEKIWSFRQWTSSRLLKKRGITGYLSLEKDEYVKISNDQIMTFDGGIDFFIYRGVVYVHNYKAFEQVFDFRKVTEQIAGETFAAFAGQIEIANVEEVRKALHVGARNLNKLARNHQKPHLEKLSLARIESLIKAENLAIQVVDGKLKVDWKNKDQLNDLLHVINDGFVRSDLTDLKYLALNHKLREGGPSQ